MIFVKKSKSLLCKFIMTNFFSFSNASLQLHMEKNRQKTDCAAFNLLQKLLTIDPLKRISAQEAMEHAFFKVYLNILSYFFKGRSTSNK